MFLQSKEKFGAICIKKLTDKEDKLEATSEKLQRRSERPLFHNWKVSRCGAQQLQCKTVH